MKTLHSVSGRASANSVRTLFLMLGCLSFAGPSLSQRPAATVKPSGDPYKLYLQGERPLNVVYTGAPEAAQSLASGQLKPLALASGDLDGDGVEDLVAGYTSAKGGVLVIHRGNLDAFAPQSEASWQAIGEGRFPSPFLSEAKVIELPEAPDFLVIGNFTGNGRLDVAVGARGSHKLYILANDGRGGLVAPKSVAVPGGLDALGTTHFDSGTPYSHIVAGTSAQTGSELIIFEGTASGIGVIAYAGLKGPANSLAFGNLSGDKFTDLAVVAGGELQLVHGRDVHAARVGQGPANLQADPLRIPFSAVSVTVGSFIQDRASRLQMAVLGTDGSVHIVTRAGLDARPWSLAEMQARRNARLNRQPDPLAVAVDPGEGWQVAESFSGAISAASPNQPSILLRTRISSRGSDDVMVLDSNLALVHVFGHENIPASATTSSSLPPSFHSTLPMSASGGAAAGIPMRVNIDGRPGVVVLKQGEPAPQVMMPLPDPTFFPNEFDDPAVPTSAPGVPDPTQFCNNTSNTDTSSPCSLREAVIKANLTAGTDTIMLAAGTYTLTIPRNAADHHTSLTGTLEVQDSLNIIGQTDGIGNPISIVQGGTSLASSVDKVFSFNEDIDSFTNATVSISNLVIQNGFNRGNTSITDGWGGAFDFDTGVTGNNTLSVTNCTISTNTLTEGEGGGFAIFNTNNGTGFATVTNSLIQNNTVAPSSPSGIAGTGGGIFVGTPAAIILNNSAVLNNSATANAGGVPIGGGMNLVGPSGNAGQSAMHGGNISGNSAAQSGGGIANTTNLLLDTGAAVVGNTAGTDGGGIYHNALGTDTLTLSKVTIRGNSATGTGGGIASGNLSGGVTLTMHFSLIAGNSATGGSANLENINSVITATNNWWGTNVPAATINTTSGGTTTFDPFVVLTHNANPQKIRINQSTTLTGDMSKDNQGNGAALAGNLDVIISRPITFDNPALGTIPQAQPETLNAIAQAFATFNAGGTAGSFSGTPLGSANATVNQGVVPVNSNLIASATESANTVTIATVGAHGFTTGENVAISGVGVSGYNTPPNQFFTITATPSATTFTYTSANTGLAASSGGIATAGIVILAPPSIITSFSPKTIQTTSGTGTTSTITFSISNPNVVPINASFTDNLPSNVGAIPGSLVVASTPSVVNNCGGSVSATAGAGSISFSNTTLLVGTCTIQVNVQSAVDNTYNNSVTIDSTDAGNGNTSSDTLTVSNPSRAVKAFGAVTIPLNGTTSLTFTIDSNNNQNLTMTGVAFTDSLPAGMVIATPGNLNSTCSGTATGPNGSSSVSLSGASVAPNTSCTVSVNVQGITAGVKNNSVQVNSTNGGAGNTSNASLTVVAPPIISKGFNPTSIALNGSSTLSFTITNPNTASPLTGVAFNDNLPSGVVVSAIPSVTSSCGGTITAPAGSGFISLSSGSLTASPAAGSSCTVSLSVTGTSAGSKSNTTGAITSTEGGTGTTSNTAVLTVVAPPSIAKAFNPTTIALNGTSSLTFTITNPATNTVAATGVAFTDTLPTGLTVASATATVCGGTLTTTAPTGIALSGATINTNSQCQFSVTVTGAASGQYTNTTGNVTSTNGGTGNTASANLTVASPPTITKSFGATSVPLNGTTSLNFTITNPAANAIVLTGVAFTDNLPAGLVVATPTGLNSTCGGTATAVAGSNSVSLSGATLATNSSCTLSVNVNATTGGVKNNSVQVTSANGGTGNTSNATLTSTAPPLLIDAFGAASIPLNGSTSLSFTIQNNNATQSLSGVGFADSLPAGLVITAPNGLTGSCGGGAITAAAGTSAISLSGASLAPSSSCTFSVNVTGTAAGQENNTTGAVTSTEGGTGGTASTSITVVAPPSIAKSFNPAAIIPNATTSLTFTITNPAANTVALTGVAFTDTLPTGLTVANASATVCGGTLTTTSPTGIALAGSTIAASGQCQFSVTVTGTTAGSYTNTTGNVTSTNGGTGNTASANLTVATPPSITKAFGTTSIGLAASTSLSFTITNANSFTFNGVGFTDPLPAGLAVSTPNGLTGTCGSGTITAAAASQTITLGGGTIAASASCTFSVNVTGTAAGTQVNTTGTVTATNGGTGNTATASITVLAPDLTIVKSHTGNFFQGQTGATYSVVVSNAGPGPTAGTATVTETPPAGLTVTALAGTGWTCTVSSLSCTRTDALAAAASYPAITVTTSVAAGSPLSVSNIATVAGGGELNTANDTAMDVTTITIPPDFTLGVTPPSISVRDGQTAKYLITVTPINNAFTNPIVLTVTGLPGRTSFAFTSSSVTPGTNPATSNLSILTAPGDPFLTQNNTKTRFPLYAMFLPFTGLVLSGLGFRKNKLARKWVLTIAIFVCSGVVLFGCASAKNFQKLGTPPGTYTVTVTATSGNLQHSAPVTLVVQP